MSTTNTHDASHFAEYTQDELDFLVMLYEHAREPIGRTLLDDVVEE